MLPRLVISAQAELQMMDAERIAKTTLTGCEAAGFSVWLKDARKSDQITCTRTLKIMRTRQVGCENQTAC